MVPSKSSYNVKKEEPSSLHQAQSTTETHPNLANSLSMKSEPSKSAGSTTDNQLAMDIDIKPVLPDDPISSLPAASKSFPVEKGESSSSKRISQVHEIQKEYASGDTPSRRHDKGIRHRSKQRRNSNQERIGSKQRPNNCQKEPEIKDDDEVMKEPEREDNRSEFVEMSREQSIIWTQAAEANRAGDEATANRLYQRLGELDSINIKYTIFAEWMHKHKLNCDAINAESGFMVALRYDITVRAKLFCLQEIRRDLMSFFLIDNPYLSGGSQILMIILKKPVLTILIIGLRKRHTYYYYYWYPQDLPEIRGTKDALMTLTLWTLEILLIVIIPVLVDQVSMCKERSFEGCLKDTTLKPIVSVKLATLPRKEGP
ncbi:hypothetical protein PSTT_10718, partial [Puccinia striiformis]